MKITTWFHAYWEQQYLQSHGDELIALVAGIGDMKAPHDWATVLEYRFIARASAVNLDDPDFAAELIAAYEDFDGQTFRDGWQIPSRDIDPDVIKDCVKTLWYQDPMLVMKVAAAVTWEKKRHA